jgi:hypothetical protein
MMQLIQHNASPATALMEQVETAIQQVASAHPMPYWLAAQGPVQVRDQAEIEKEDKL